MTFFVTVSGFPTVTLQEYITQVQLLLHDRDGQFYQQSDLIGYINSARNRLVRDTGCLRTLLTWYTVTGQETYPLYQWTQANTTVLDVINVNLYFGNTRYALAYLPWTQFNARMRFWQNFNQRPTACSLAGQQTLYLGPVPDQVYQMESDVVYLPAPLVATTDSEVISEPYISPIKYYAAHLAKMYEQSYNDAEMFRSRYNLEMQNVLKSSFTRRITTPYEGMV
ncbi:MAG: hypothetical protein KGL39_52315 [Patescibacteria group bacterium]|nr:hypothetical protein [Patescibacteria group bacterium]